MATTYTLISSNVLTSSAASVTFSSIPSTYTDLVLRISARESSASSGSPTRIRFNGASTDANLSGRILAYDGSSAYSTTAATGYLGQWEDATATANTFGSVEVYIPNYLAATNKPFSSINVYENNSATMIYIEATASLFRDTTAISSLQLLPYSTSNFISGSSFYLYGIKNS